MASLPEQHHLVCVKWMREGRIPSLINAYKFWATFALKVIGWGCFYLSTILDDYSRYIIA